MSTKFSKAEKTMIALVNNNYATYKCKAHGIFQQRNDIATGKCPTCGKTCAEMDNIAELKEKFRKDLGLS